MRLNTNLPITEVIPELKSALALGRNVVLEAEPGAGKTTIVPLELLNEAWLAGKKIVMLEPRRLAARSAASRMADLLGEEVGATVGYRTRMDTRVSRSTRIEVVTEGVLTRLIQNDQSLKGIGIVIFDEFHERSIHADLGLALSLEIQSVLREDLRLLVMSATLDGREISSLLGGAPVIKGKGRSHPVEVRYLPDALSRERDSWLTGSSYISRVANSIIRTLREEEGSILVFLPGGGEIRRVESALKEGGIPPSVEIAPLYGDLPREAQDAAIRPSPPGKRKVVLATSIAETSLTIEGIRVVIDGGLSRISRYSPSTGMSTLETYMVNRASADQRAGRAGRLGPGICQRLWTRGEDAALRERGSPEILEADLAPLALELAVWGIRDPSELRWLDPPPAGVISHARELLEELGAIGIDGSATHHGTEMARLPLHPRLAHMVIRGKELGMGATAAYLAALLSERDIFRKGSQGEIDSDVRLRLEQLMNRVASGHADRGGCEMIKQSAAKIIKTTACQEGTGAIDNAGLLLSFAYPDRIGKRREGGEARYLLSNGRGAAFPRHETLSSQTYIVAATLEGGERESMIYLAAPISLEEILKYHAPNITDLEEVVWDQGQKGVVSRRVKRLWGLVLAESQLQSPDRGKGSAALLHGIRENGLGVLPWDAVAETMRGRINFLHGVSSKTGIEFPDLTDEWLLENLYKWLTGWVEGMTRLDHLKRVDLVGALRSILTWEQQKALERLAPTHVTVPTGSRIAIDYASGGKPVLAVKLQEMFGLKATPTVADGKIRLVVHLLSPAGRPLQVTEDLAGFWSNSYPLVKKEMKGRYPKHDWPDDPAHATPSRGAKRRQG